MFLVNIADVLNSLQFSHRIVFKLFITRFFTGNLTFRYALTISYLLFHCLYIINSILKIKIATVSKKDDLYYILVASCCLFFEGKSSFSSK